MIAGIKASLLTAAEGKMFVGNSRAICEGNRQDQMKTRAAEYLGAKFVRSKTC